MWCEMTEAESQHPVLLQDKMFTCKYIPSKDLDMDISHKYMTL